jgi:maltose alpha-D-glucosyltransferase/alpha-amylase
VMDHVFGYQAVNVEAELENGSSLLHWTRRMIHIRKEHPTFGLGSFRRPRWQQPVRAVVPARVRR